MTDSQIVNVSLFDGNRFEPLYLAKYLQDWMRRHPKSIVEHISISPKKKPKPLTGMNRYGYIPPREPDRYRINIQLDILVIDPDMETGKVKLEDFEKVERLVQKRNELIKQKQRVIVDDTWSISIKGKYHDEYKNELQRYLIAEIDKRLDDIFKELESLGVSI